ncbi:MAG: sulfatase [Actinomycetota bacterium]|nr:sulfatase [Actinomycetota bacterium]
MMRSSNAGRPRGTRVIRIRTVLLVASVLAALALPLSRNDQVHAAPKPDIVIILLDDQRVGTEDSLPSADALIAGAGVRLANAMVPTSWCCPSRTSLLTGDFSHTTGVYDNSGPDGGFAGFDDSVTLATELDDAGYRTGLFGKYLNGYGAAGTGDYVPPGWDRWAAMYGRTGYDPGIEWLDAGGTGDPVLGVTDDYSTTFFGDRVEQFIRSADPSRPIFAYYAPFAPHAPATPMPADDGAFEGFRWRPESYNEADVSDKPGYIRRVRRLDPNARRRLDAFVRDQKESMLAVDREVAQIVQALHDRGTLQNTIIVLMSDNGFMWGEHRFIGKAVPYDMSTRIPMAIRWSAGGWSGGRTADQIVANVDVAPTLLEAAGIAGPPMDGVSLDAVLSGSADPVRDGLVLEANGSGRSPAYCGIRTARYLFVRYAGGFEELYSYAGDPLELRNRAGTTGAADRTALLRRRARALCAPTPPGFSWR